VLSRSAIAVLAGLSLVFATGGAVTAQAATGSRNSAAAHAAAGSQAPTGAEFPAGAKDQLSSELTQAWQITRGQGVTIAVLSTAVDAVSGLAGKLTQGPDYAPLSGAPALDGTILASMIAGSGPTGTNPFGTIGCAPGAKILAEQMVNYGAEGQRDQKYEQDGTWQNLTAKAIRYALKQWEGLIRFLDDGRIEIDSNTVERAMRPVALTRKNALFAGSDEGAENWAMLASLIETCKLHGVNPEAYFTDVLTKLVNNWPNSRLDELMPWAWDTTKPA